MDQIKGELKGRALLIGMDQVKGELKGRALLVGMDQVKGEPKGRALHQKWTKLKGNRREGALRALLVGMDPKISIYTMLVVFTLPVCYHSLLSCESFLHVGFISFLVHVWHPCFPLE